MIKFNNKFVNKIINSNGEEGKEWLKSIESILLKYKELLKLNNIKLLENLTTNIIFNANSDLYGDVVIKLMISNKTFSNEINFINNCKSKYMVKCFYHNFEDKIMVLERIKPGLPLNTIENRTDRIKIFSDIMNDIIISETDENLYRDYFNSFLNKINNQGIINKVNKNIKEKIKKSLQLYNEINEMNLPKYVLHRDLHHNNILKSKTTWKVIDPQGVIGYNFFELTQFIKSELTFDNNNISKIREIVENINKIMNFDLKLIYMALYIDTVEKILYFISIGASKYTIDYNIKICDEVIKYIT